MGVRIQRIFFVVVLFDCGKYINWNRLWINDAVLSSFSIHRKSNLLLISIAVSKAYRNQSRQRVHCTAFELKNGVKIWLITIGNCLRVTVSHSFRITVHLAFENCVHMLFSSSLPLGFIYQGHFRVKSLRYMYADRHVRFFYLSLLEQR